MAHPKEQRIGVGKDRNECPVVHSDVSFEC